MQCWRSSKRRLINHKPVPIVDKWLSYKKLKDELGWTQEHIAEAKGCSQNSVSRRLKFADFPKSVLEYFIPNNFLKEGHARELLNLSQWDNFQDWFTEEDAMLEIIKKSLHHSKTLPLIS